LNHKHLFKRHPSLARISIWTVVHHDFLAAQIRIYVWAASATVLFLSITGLIPLQLALHLLLFGGLGVLILIGSLINWRRSILLGIQDDDLRLEAHAAMLSLIHSRPHSVENQSGLLVKPHQTLTGPLSLHRFREGRRTEPGRPPP